MRREAHRYTLVPEFTVPSFRTQFETTSTRSDPSSTTTTPTAFESGWDPTPIRCTLEKFWDPGLQAYKTAPLSPLAATR
eukprot:1394465-Rhodomonas_salina.2